MSCIRSFPFVLITLISLWVSACDDDPKPEQGETQAGVEQDGAGSAGVDAPDMGGAQMAGAEEVGGEVAGAEVVGGEVAGAEPQPAGVLMSGPCEGAPCQNGGLCQELADSFTCECRDGFLGDTCAERVPTYVSFSGGGWHSHTSLAGWVAGLLDSTGQDLTHAFEHVDGLSANSGGGWFMSMLAYSPSFVNGLELDRDQYAESGYLGQVTELFDGALNDEPCVGWGDLLDSAVTGEMVELICEYFPKYQGHFGVYKLNRDEQGQVHLNWHRLVHQVVYQPLGLEDELAGITLSSPHLSWASDKSLMYASNAMTDEVMLAYDQDARLYWGIYASLSAGESLPTQHGATPVVFTSPGDSGAQAQPVFTAGALRLTHEEVGVDPVSASIGAVDASNVSIFDASIASSAALAFGASYGMLDALSPVSTGLMTTSWFLSGLAPPADLTGGELRFRRDGRIYNEDGDVGYESFDSLASTGTVRLGDGGFVDNAAVTTLVRHIQQNQQGDFQLVAFMNSTSPQVSLGTFELPSSIRELFVDPAQLPEPGVKSTCASPERCLLTPSNHVFTPASWDSAELLWVYQESEVTLRYFRVSVETQSNDTFSITAGQRGTLHLFIHTTPRTSALPKNQSELEAYQDVYRVTRAGIAEHGGALWLKRALGLE